MPRFLRTLLLVVILAAIAAVGLVLWLSPDPRYSLTSWYYGDRFHMYDREIHEVARKHEIDPLLVKAVIWRESRFHPDKVGGAGERGLMQVTEAAAQDWVRAEKIENFAPTDLFDARTNITVGTWYLSKAMERYKERENPVPFALAEYNAGKSRVDRWVTESKMGAQATSGDLLKVMDYPTTKKYIGDITRRYEIYKREARDR
ncbi:MAG: lytic transglycosylase domain-containing protein [Chthoniobacteraceae bacterium]